MSVESDFAKRLGGLGLLTAEILYRLPDYPEVLQSFLWQTEDKAPDFPELSRFLAFWEREIHGPIHSVRVAHQRLLKPYEFRAFDGNLCLH